ncbi:MAG: hypothetical protein Kow00109_08240 [Acidobacteriota bacterium]
MRLGNFVEIALNVPDLARSLPFYERMGFDKLDQAWEPWPWVILSDGAVTLQLNQGTPGLPVLAYIAGDMEQRITALEASGVRVERTLGGRGEPRAVFRAPAGLEVALVDYPARRIPRGEGGSYCKLGSFGELAWPVEEVEEAVRFWQGLGFEKRRGHRLPYPWAILSDGLMTLGLYATRDVEKPALVYYANNPAERLEMLATEGFEPQGEIPSPISGVGRYIFEPPDGQIWLMLDYRD